MGAKRLYSRLGYRESSVTAYDDSYRYRSGTGSVVWVPQTCAWLLKDLVNAVH